MNNDNKEIVDYWKDFYSRQNKLSNITLLAAHLVSTSARALVDGNEMKLVIDAAVSMYEAIERKA